MNQWASTASEWVNKRKSNAKKDIVHPQYWPGDAIQNRRDSKRKKKRAVTIVERSIINVNGIFLLIFLLIVLARHFFLHHVHSSLGESAFFDSLRVLLLSFLYFVLRLIFGQMSAWLSFNVIYFSLFHLLQLCLLTYTYAIYNANARSVNIFIYFIFLSLLLHLSISRPYIGHVQL